MAFICPQCKRRVPELFSLIFSTGKVCGRCFELEAKEGLLEELEWNKFQLSARLKELTEESLWEDEYLEEKAYLREELEICQERIENLNQEIDELYDMG